MENNISITQTALMRTNSTIANLFILKQCELKSSYRKIAMGLSIALLSYSAAAEIRINAQPVVINDAMSELIAIQQQDYADRAGVVVEERRVYRNPQSTGEFSVPIIAAPVMVDINTWLNADSRRQQEALAYQSYLASQIGIYNVPPLSELLLNARDWQKCGAEPYTVPPRHLWNNNVNTFRLYALLKQRGILPASTQIRSVYRDPALNICAGGAVASQHVHNTSIDIWVPEYEGQDQLVHQLQDRLCTFRLTEGPAYDFGLGLYPNNSYHIDTHRVRIWGADSTPLNSSCRIPLVLPETVSPETFYE